MIPGELEKLILTGKARHDIITHLGGAFASWEIAPDELVIIYGVTMFPFHDIQEGGNRPFLSVFQLTIYSPMSRDTLPVRFPGPFLQTGTETGDPLYIPMYAIHRDKLTLDLRKIQDPPAWAVSNAFITPQDKAQAQPYGQTGLAVVDQIDLEPAVPFNFNSWPNVGTPKPGANNVKPENPASINSTLTSISVMQPFADAWSYPIVYLHCVYANSVNFNKLMTR